MTMLSTLPSPLISTGEQQKRITTRFGLPSGSRCGELGEDLDVAPVGRVAFLGVDELAAGLVELHLGRVDDDVGLGQLAELAHLGVGERRLGRPAAAEDDDLLDPRARRAPRSRGRRCRSISSSARGRASIRATSAATLPLPITTARLRERSNSWSAKSGWALYQLTNSVAACEPGRSSPGMPSWRSVAVP